MDKPAVCIATNRPESFEEWVKAWADEFTREDVALFVMADTEDVGMRRKLGAICVDRISNARVYTHEDVASDLGDNAWIIPKKTSACKSFAIYKAWKHGRDPIMVLDDDCLPLSGEQWIEGHRNELNSRAFNHVWQSLIRPEVRSRGTPYLEPNQVALSHGVWVQNIDIDAIATFVRDGGSYTSGIDSHNGHVPIGALFPMSGMNVAFRREIAPLMYFGLQGPTWGVDRFDDIWCGFLAKKVLDHCGYAVWSGSPYVRHVKASDPFVNIVKEAPGYKMNVELYQRLINLHLNSEKIPEAVLGDLAMALDFWSRNGGREYWASYGKAILAWLELFQPELAYGD